MKLLKSINAKLTEDGGEPLKESLLEEIFNESWTKLEARLNEAITAIKNSSDAEAVPSPEKVRTDNDKLDEILEILRTQQRFPNVKSTIGLGRGLRDFESNFTLVLTIEMDERLESVNDEYIREYLTVIFDTKNVERDFVKANVYHLSFDKSISDVESLSHIRHFESRTGLNVKTYSIR